MSPAATLRPEVLQARQRLEEGRRRLRRRHLAGASGTQICYAWAELIDQVVLELFERIAAEMVPPQVAASVTLVPHGGYGRRDMAPFSDIDLMVLLPGRASPELESLLKRFISSLFDLGLQVGQSVRTVTQACQLAARDAQIYTSLAESRFLAGDAALFHRFLRRFQRMTRRRRRWLLAEVEQARLQEQAQYGETIYLLEPNLKRSRGGLRDIQLLRWLGFAHYGVADPESLFLRGVLSREDFYTLRDAWEYLLHLRNELHFHAGRAHDVLDRGEQVRLASHSRYMGTQGLLPVEQFMREYFRRTYAVSRIVRQFLQGVRRRHVVLRALQRATSRGTGFRVRAGTAELFVPRRELPLFPESLQAVFHLARLQAQTRKPVEAETLQAVRQRGPSLARNVTPEQAQAFLELLDDPATVGPVLRWLYEVGVLEEIVPPLKHAHGLLQFNEYHKYTVDEHSLRAVEEAASFADRDDPLGHAYRSLGRRRLLHLALLLHDLGKGYPEDHSQRGKQLARDVASRLHLDEEAASLLEFLVGQHLLMAHTAFRRDTSEESLLVQFAFQVGTPERLQMLYVLSAADLAAVGPGVLNPWKVDVLTSLYDRTMMRLSGRLDAVERHLQRLRDRVAQALGDKARDPWFAEMVRELPPAYLYARPAEQIAQDLQQLRPLSPRDVLVQGHYDPESETVQYTVAAHEQITPGIFHKLTGALSSLGLQILAAEINTLAHGLVLDRFVVADERFSGEVPEGRIDEVCQALQGAVQGTFEPQFRPRRWRSQARRRPQDLRPLPTQVRTDNSVSDRFTVIDVFAEDRLGLLYAITQALFEMGLSVHAARIATYLDQVVDVFYVSDRQGGKIEDTARLQQIRQRLLEAVERLRQQEVDQPSGLSSPHWR